MSKIKATVSRSEYQRVVEENKRLKKDIEAIVMRDDEESLNILAKWMKYFKHDRGFRKLLIEAAKNMKNAQSLPKR